MLIYARRRDAKDTMVVRRDLREKREGNFNEDLGNVRFCLSFSGAGSSRKLGGGGGGVIYGALNETFSLICGYILYPFNMFDLRWTK